MEAYNDLEFTWDGYSIAGAGDFAIAGVRIRDIPSDTDLLTCDSLRIRTSLLTLALRGQDPIRGVTSVELNRPVCSLGRTHDRWNTGNLLEPREVEPYRFPGRLGIVVKNGVIDWRGGEIAHGFPFPPARISGLNGIFRIGANGGMGLTLDGMLSASEIEPAAISLQGTYDPDRYLIHLNVGAQALDMTLGREIASKYRIHELAGLADTSVSFLIGPDAGRLGYSILGKADISGGSAHTDFLDMTLEDVSGTIHFSHESVFASGLQGKVDGAPTTASGRLADFGARRLSIDLVADAQGIQKSFIAKVAPVAENFPLTGAFNTRLELASSTQGITALVSADSPSLSVLTVPISLDDFFGWYSDGRLVAQRAEVGVAGGRVAADGTIDIAGDKPVYEFHVEATDVRSEELAAYIPIAARRDMMPRGVLSGEADVSGRGVDPPTIEGRLLAQRLTVPAYPGLPPARATVPFACSENEIRISGACIDTQGAILLAEGEYSPGGSFKGSVELTVEDPHLVQRGLGIPFQGEFAVAGDISYSVPDGAGFTGECYLTDGNLGGIDAPDLSARVALSPSEIRVWELSGLVGGGEIAGELTIPIAVASTRESSSMWTSPIGTFVLTHFNVGRLLPPQYASIVSTSLEFNGEAEYSREERLLTFNVSVVEPAARVGPNTMFTDDEGISLRIALPLADRENASVLVSGVLNSRPAGAPVYRGRVLTPYSARVVREVTDLLTGRVVQMGEAEALALPAVTGSFDIQAILQRAFTSPFGTIEITTGAVDVSGIQLVSAAAHLASENGANWDVGLEIDAGDAGSFRIGGEIERGPTLAESTLALSAAIENSGLDGLFRLMGLAGMGRSSGTVDGSGTIGGTLTNPFVDEFQLTLGESEAFGIPLSQGGATFAYDPPVLNVTGLEIEGSDGFRALGAGAIDLTSPSLAGANLVLRVDEFNLQVISRALDIRFPLAGVASGTLQLAQDAFGPKILYSARIDGISWLSDTESLFLGDLTFSAETRPGDPQLNIKNLLLTRNGEQISLSGLIPANLRDSGAELFDLRLISDTGFTPPVPPGAITPGLAWDGGLGSVHLALTGSIAYPVISGEMNFGIRNVRAGETVLVNSIGDTLRIENSVIKLSPDGFRMTGDGWEAGLNGWIDLKSLLHFLERAAITSPIADIELVRISDGPLRLNGPGFELQVIPGTDKEAIRLTSQARWPDFEATIEGKVSVVGGQVDIARLPEFPTRDPDVEVPESPLSFNLRAELLAGLRVQNGNMLNLTFESAQIDLTGNLSYPVLAGSLYAPTGWIDLFGNHFVLIEPVEMTLSSFYPPTNPHVKATAQTHLREARSPGLYGEELVVTARIDSRLSNLMENLSLTSDPPLSQDELMAALAYEDVMFRTFGSYVLGDSRTSPGFGDVDFTGVALPLATSYLSRYIRREAGFSDFEISFDREQNILIYLEEEVFDNVVMYYSQKFGPTAEDDFLWGARYRWRPRSWVGFEVDNEEKITPQVEYIIPIN